MLTPYSFAQGCFAWTLNSATSLIALSAFQDNYIWLLKQNQRAIVIDPGDATIVQQYLLAEHLSLQAILITHQHKDHIGGLSQLRTLWPQAAVYVPAATEHAAQLEGTIGQQGDQIEWPQWSGYLQVLHVPGHTLNHLAYVFWQDEQAPLLFCGDTLFSAGCGRLFEGTAEQLYHSLQKIQQLPANTLICCAHEYTQNNLRFATSVEPDNLAIQTHQQRVSTLRSANLPSLPSSLALEQSINPFLRTDQRTLQQRWQQPDTITLLAFLRAWKNNA